jgi:Bacterial protein of unknown function (DUF885)
MKQMLSGLALSCLLFLAGCSRPNQDNGAEADKTFSEFETVFLDAYWKQYPANAISVGYGKYYDKLVIPDSVSLLDDIAFSRRWSDSLSKLDFEKLNDNNKISFNIIKNQLESDNWYLTVFKPQQWDPSIYNISGECDYIINQPYAPLEERLGILNRHLLHADDYYRAALKNLDRPAKEQLELAILQNQGGLSVFGKSLTDSIDASHLSPGEKDSIKQNIDRTTRAMNGFISGLKAMDSDRKQLFRDFRIGKELFAAKFKYDLAIDLSPEQLYEKAMADKQLYHQKMFDIANGLWQGYFPSESRPADTLQLIQRVMDRIQLNHARTEDFFDSLVHQVYRLKKFIVEKNLFDFDTLNPPILVRLMPEYARGFAVANAEFTPPYLKKGDTYFNIDDLTKYSPEKAEGSLREYNNYASQLLCIHEAVPGHCVQGIYNSKKSPDVLRSVFQNGAMVEGWAVYTEGMMVENGWGGNTPEMQLVLDKWKLRELANVLVDYDVQCLNRPRDSIVALLVRECFQTSAQAAEKYHRATVSQVQLCSYFAGATAIFALREDYKKKMGDQYSLKDFHEKFLSFGSSPVKYIRERMLP